ncbi:glycosyltransferase [Waterburya agarophytonicola K14]|uniref:Glycosyltransferase n=1 Tax=Waterburya agarophytonicola KI4 TaxID=2874699 RepID=A0A964BWW1_9CYAN|nr:glycosyltransferase [Waterburya agarophytonicola]MCC0179588.1 glycosyltransferase [Waterburya agarophytonicola KI4]
MSKVSVIIPNYNRSQVIGETINNMLDQSLPPHEVIVIDDGSTDNSVEVIKSFGDRVTLIQQSNKGPGAARNAGLKIASGEFIQLMDSDDLLSLNKLEIQAKKLIKEDANLVYSPWAKVFFDRQNIKLENVVLQQAAVPNNRDLLTSYLTGWSIVLQQCLLRNSLVKKVGLYRTDMWTCDDSDFFLRILLAQPQITFASETLTLYRLNDYGKVTGSGFTNKNRLEDWARFLLSAADKIKNKDHLQAAIRHPKFLTNVWKTYYLLKSLESSATDLIEGLNLLLNTKSNLNYWKIYSRMIEINSGIQNRLKGHRWSENYQVGKLNVSQKQLIADLGYYSS